MNNKNNLYYIIKIKIDDTKYNIEKELDTSEKSVAVSKAKEYKQNKDILSIKLMERLYGYEDRVIYEFERG